jgi:hypothetical protein
VCVCVCVCVCACMCACIWTCANDCWCPRSLEESVRCHRSWRSYRRQRASQLSTENWTQYMPLTVGPPASFIKNNFLDGPSLRLSSKLCLCNSFHGCFVPNSKEGQVYLCTPEEGIRSHYRWLWATMWLLGIELRTSGRSATALNHWAISPVLIHCFEVCLGF